MMLDMKKKHANTDTYRAMRAAARDATLDALRDGRKVRAATIPNKRRQADRLACRGKVTA